MRHICYLSALILACLAHSAAGQDRLPSVASIAKVRPCASSQVKTTGYVHPSHHGSWISDNPRLHGAGLPIESIEPDAPNRNKLLGYMYRPQDNLHSTFKATFSGVVSCNEHGIPVLNVHKVEQIEITPVRVAE
jgi:hypothetical protein